MKYILVIILFSFSIRLFPQIELRNNEELMYLLEKNLACIYNYQFDKAYATLSSIEKVTGDHPVVPFLEGLITYWSNNPLMADSEDASRFIALMGKCMAMSDSIVKSHPDDVEMTFFSLVSRAMLMLHYADNDMSIKVIPYANDAYHLTILGSDMKEVFKEFYFVSGLYNYYRVAYPEAHPIYKPLLVVFKPGDKAEGIRQIRYAIEHSVFIRIESKLYLTYIYLHYENNPIEALNLMTELYSEFPNNQYFLSKQAELLLINNQYKEARPLVRDLMVHRKDDLFSTMKGMIFKGVIEEKLDHDLKTAKKNYLDGITLAEGFKSWGNIYKAFAYKGLSRIAAMEGDKDKQKEYRKQANKNTPYEYIKNWE